MDVTQQKTSCDTLYFTRTSEYQHCVLPPRHVEADSLGNVACVATEAD